jgi:hypothetical protein
MLKWTVKIYDGRGEDGADLRLNTVQRRPLVDTAIFCYLPALPASDGRMIMKWKLFGRKLLWPNPSTARHLPASTEENHEKSQCLG